MSTSKKTPASIRQGGPGSSHETAKAPLEIPKPDSEATGNRSRVSGGGGEHDRHHTHDPKKK
jgi:hypothetical protein